MATTKIWLDVQSDLVLTSPSITSPTGIVKGDVGLGNVDNTSDVNKPVSTAQQTAIDLAETDAKSYADGLVVGLFDDRGNFDASVNTFPASGGSGSAGAILKGDLWTVSVAGTLGGVAVSIGDLVRAIVDTPGQTASNWAIAEGNTGYTAENSANKVTSISGSSTDTQSPSAKLVYDQLVLKLAAASIVTREVPSGTINSINVTFTIANALVVGSESLFKNGLLQDVGAGNDYTISGTTITFNQAPRTNSKLLVSYIKS